MIRDDVFIFDNVVHMYDYSDESQARMSGVDIGAKKREFGLFEKPA
ncbi:MAG: hypothetical protein V3V56_03690 [bacterium]